MSALVRSAEAADLPLLAGIEAAADQQFTPLMDISGWSAPPAGESRAAEPGFVLVAGEPVVGFAHVLDLDGHLHLEQLAVHPRSTRQGIGTALLDSACRAARLAGAGSVTLLTFADVPWNAPFYERRGFRQLEPPLPAALLPLVANEARLGLGRCGRRVAMIRTT